MDKVFKKSLKPLENSVVKGAVIGLALVTLAIAAALLALGYLLLSHDISITALGIFLAWAGSAALFYAVITEEHTLKEYFLRKSYFLTGLLAMITGMFLTFFAEFFSKEATNGLPVEFGFLLMVFGAVLVILSAQKYRDYSKSNSMFSFFAGILFFIGGLLARNETISYLGVFVMIFSVAWLSLKKPN